MQSIYAHSDYQFIVHFDHKSSIKGYDPDKYLEIHQQAEGKKAQDKINSTCRALYPKIKDERNEKRRKLYQEKNFPFI